jgi:hypothetical protein
MVSGASRLRSVRLDARLAPDHRAVRGRGRILKDFRRGRCLDPLFGYVAKEPDRWFPKWMLNT